MPAVAPVPAPAQPGVALRHLARLSVRCPLSVCGSRRLRRDRVSRAGLELPPARSETGLAAGPPLAEPVGLSGLPGRDVGGLGRVPASVLMLEEPHPFVCVSGRLRAWAFLPSPMRWDCRMDSAVWGGVQGLRVRLSEKADAIPVSVWQCEADRILLSGCLMLMFFCQ